MVWRRVTTAAVAVAAGVGAVLAAGVPAAAQSSSGVPDLRIQVDYGCRTEWNGPNDWRTSAHVFTTVGNVGSAPVRDVTARIAVASGYVTAHPIPVLEPGQSVTFDDDTRMSSLIIVPTVAAAFGAGLDANPLDNVYVGVAPFVCSAL